MQGTREADVLAPSQRKSLTTRPMGTALGGKESRDILERRLLDAVFETHRNLPNYDIKVLSVATVDAQGVIITAP